MRVVELPLIGRRISFAAAGIGVVAVPVFARKVLNVERNLPLHSTPPIRCDQEIALVVRRKGSDFAALAAFHSILLENYGSSDGP